MRFNAQRLFKKCTLTLRKQAPNILVGAGIIGVGVGVYEACKATRKLDVIIDEHREEAHKIEEMSSNNLLPEDESKRYLVQETAKLYTSTGLKLAKLYGPAVLILSGSVSCILGSHTILTKRNAALGAAYATIDSCFKRYRKNVIEKYGEEIDQELRHGIKLEKPKKGEVVDISKPRKATSDDEKLLSDYSDYARFFDESSINWEKDSEYNLTFLKGVESFANNKLKADGYLFLNDVYSALGIPKSKAGQVVGWIYDPEDKTKDSFVDFKIYDITSKAARDFVNGIESRILLDFNVDGNILDVAL